MADATAPSIDDHEWCVEMAKRHEAGETQAALAREFGIKRQRIRTAIARAKRGPKRKKRLRKVVADSERGLMSCRKNKERIEQIVIAMAIHVDAFSDDSPLKVDHAMAVATRGDIKRWVSVM